MKIIIAVVLIVTVIAASAFLQMYYIREDSGGQLLWSADEAYLFMGETRRGFHLSYLEYPWEMLKECLHAPAFPSENRASLTVIRVTANAVERHVLDVEVGGGAPNLFTPIGRTIYANCKGTLCKWSGAHFEPATEEEQRRLDDTNHLSAIDIENVNGWSKRGVGATAGDNHFSVEPGKLFTLSVKQGNIYKSANDSASVDLLRPGQAPEKLWYVDGYPHRVSKSEYEQTFGKH